MNVLTKERWVTIREFPNYQLSNRGEILNLKTGRLMKTNQNNYGHTKITLTDFDGSRHDRSVAFMVAEAFVKRPNFMCDHVIVLDGNLSNVKADNLAWRPDGFAWKYTHQFKIHYPHYYKNLPVRNVVTGVEYDCIVSAAISEGLLFEDIWRSVNTGYETYPDGSIFEVIR